MIETEHASLKIVLSLVSTVLWYEYTTIIAEMLLKHSLDGL